MDEDVPEGRSCESVDQRPQGCHVRQSRHVQQPATRRRHGHPELRKEASMLFQQTVGGTYASAAGGGSTTTPNAVNERIFRVVRNSFTATATITAASFVRGNP